MSERATKDDARKERQADRERIAKEQEKKKVEAEREKP